MKRNVTLVPRQPTLLTLADVTAGRIQNHGPGDVLLDATVGGATAPDFVGAVKLIAPDGGIEGPWADYFPDPAGANRIWAWSAEETKVSVNHA